MNNSAKTPRSFGTHDGTFHADEVTACALLILFNLIDRDKIIRTRQPEQLACCDYVCDVGGLYNPASKLFDHHQHDYQGPLSSAGMILLHLKTIGVISQKEQMFLENSLIAGVDAHDNGKELHEKGVCTYSHVVSNFTPITHDATAENQDTAFFNALDFALGHLTRMWQRHQYVMSCKQNVVAAMENGKDFLIFNANIPWMESFFENGGASHPAKFVVMPSGEHWKLRGIPPTMEEKMKVRVPLPLEWAGLLEKELKEISGIQGAIFCHKGLFISVWETRKDALEALSHIININQVNEKELYDR